MVWGHNVDILQSRQMVFGLLKVSKIPPILSIQFVFFPCSYYTKGLKMLILYFNTSISDSFSDPRNREGPQEIWTKWTTKFYDSNYIGIAKRNCFDLVVKSPLMIPAHFPKLKWSIGFQISVKCSTPTNQFCIALTLKNEIARKYLIHARSSLNTFVVGTTPFFKHSSCVHGKLEIC